MTYAEQRETLIRYLKHKTEIADWHGVSDAANDLRVLEAEEQGRARAINADTGRERVEHCGPDSEQMLLSIIDPSHSPLADSYRVAEIEHPAGCACLPCRNKVM